MTQRAIAPRRRRLAGRGPAGRRPARRPRAGPARIPACAARCPVQLRAHHRPAAPAPAARRRPPARARSSACPAGYARAFPGELRTLAGQRDRRAARPADGGQPPRRAGRHRHHRPARARPPAKVRVDGVVDLPAGRLALPEGRRAGRRAAAGAARQRRPAARSATFARVDGPLAPRASRAGAHAGPRARSRTRLPGSPSAAFTQVSGRARATSRRGWPAAGSSATTSAPRSTRRASDALYAQLLFLFLGVPGRDPRRAGDRVDRRGRRRTAAAATRRCCAPAAPRRASSCASRSPRPRSPAAPASRSGSAPRWSSAQRRLRHRELRRRDARRRSLWAVGAALAGLADRRGVDRAARLARRARADRGRPAPAGRPPRPRAVVGALRPGLRRPGGLPALVFWQASRNGYNLVLAPEGVPQVSVNWYALLAPVLAWIGAGLLAYRIADLVLVRGRSAAGARRCGPLAGELAPTVAATMGRQRRLLAGAVALVALTAAFAASTAVFNATYQQQAEVDARLTNGADVTVTESPGVQRRAARRGRRSRGVRRAQRRAAAAPLRLRRRRPAGPLRRAPADDRRRRQAPERVVRGRQRARAHALAGAASRRRARLRRDRQGLPARAGRPAAPAPAGRPHQAVQDGPVPLRRRGQGVPDRAARLVLRRQRAATSPGPPAATRSAPSSSRPTAATPPPSPGASAPASARARR